MCEIFLRYTDHIKPLSLDESYLDVTDNKIGIPTATKAAIAIRLEIPRRAVVDRLSRGGTEEVQRNSDLWFRTYHSGFVGQPLHAVARYVS